MSYLEYVYLIINTCVSSKIKDLYTIELILFSYYSSVRVIATRILHEISLLIGEFAIIRTKLTLNAGLGT